MYTAAFTMQLEIQPGKSYTYSANERGAWRNDRGVEQSKAEQSRVEALQPDSCICLSSDCTRGRSNQPYLRPTSDLAILIIPTIRCGLRHTKTLPGRLQQA